MWTSWIPPSIWGYLVWASLNNCAFGSHQSLQLCLSTSPIKDLHLWKTLYNKFMISNRLLDKFSQNSSLWLLSSSCCWTSSIFYGRNLCVCIFFYSPYTVETTQAWENWFRDCLLFVGLRTAISTGSKRHFSFHIMMDSASRFLHFYQVIHRARKLKASNWRLKFLDYTLIIEHAREFPCINKNIFNVICYVMPWAAWVSLR